MFRSLLLLLLLLLHLLFLLYPAPDSSSFASLAQGKVVSDGPFHHDLPSNVTKWEVFPELGLEQRFFNSSRRSLGSFQVCALCTCCGEGRRFCIPTACCYTIACGSPDKPFGFCSFQPMACNCFNCRI